MSGKNSDNTPPEDDEAKDTGRASVDDDVGEHQGNTKDEEKKLLRVLANRRSAKASRARRSNLFADIQSNIDVILLPTNKLLQEENFQLKSQVQQLRQQILLNKNQTMPMMARHHPPGSGATTSSIVSNNTDSLISQYQHPPIDPHQAMLRNLQMQQQLLQIQSANPAIGHRPLSEGVSGGGMMTLENNPSAGSSIGSNMLGSSILSHNQQHHPSPNTQQAILRGRQIMQQHLLQQLQSASTTTAGPMRQQLLQQLQSVNTTAGPMQQQLMQQLQSTDTTAGPLVGPIAAENGLLFAGNLPSP